MVYYPNPYCQNPYTSPCIPGYCFLNDIAEYIHDELSDSRYYAILATKAPTARAKEILLEFSSDEKKHAENFQRAYYQLTGRTYVPAAVEEPNVPDYMDALKVRILAETNDYKKYGEKYLQVCEPYLKDLFFMTRTVEAQHAMRIPLLMEEGR